MWSKARFSVDMQLLFCVAFVSLNTWKCTWVCPVSLVNGVLSHYCTCLKGYLAIVVLGRTGAASVAAHFRTYFRWQEKTTTWLCQRSSIVFISVKEIVITCVCVCKEGPQPFCSEKRSNVYGTVVCVRAPSYFHTCFGGRTRYGSLLTGNSFSCHIRYVE